MTTPVFPDEADRPKSSKCRRPFEYDPLPTASSIRLLNIKPVDEPDDAVIHCQLFTVDLDEQPEFDALSYTWGDPITIREMPDGLEDMGKNPAEAEAYGARGSLLDKDILVTGTNIPSSRTRRSTGMQSANKKSFATGA